MLKSATKIFAVLAFVSNVYAQFTSFEDFLSQINSAPQNEKQNIANNFITFAQNTTGIPYTQDDTLACFLYNSGSGSVTVPGDFNGWDPNASYLTNITGTSFYYKQFVFPSDSRLDYKFVVSGNWILDPLNPHQVSGGFGPNSELSMPAYVQPPEILFYPNIPHGTVSTFQFTSTILNNTKTVHVYLPPGYTNLNTYPTFYFQDGTETKNLGKLVNVLDYLISDYQLYPLVVVMVNPTDRMTEYTMNANYSNFLANELVPYIDANYSTSQNPAFRGIAGASLGGLISFYTAFHNPNVFGKAAGQSSSFWWNNQAMINEIQNASTQNVDFYFDAGTFNDGLADNQQMETVLQNKGYTYFFQTWNEGHSWGNWRAHFDEFLVYFFPSIIEVNEKKNSEPQNFTLNQNYPNPFNPSTKIDYDLPKNTKAKLLIFNVKGEKVREFELTASKGFVEWNGTNQEGKLLGSGVYLYTIQGENFSESKKMVLLK
ncbi:T9SS type A sorting domain-containing protein [bacterium]|nr:T9SS type A sorting domain-containing protein [bacterium]